MKTLARIFHASHSEAMGKADETRRRQDSSALAKLQTERHEIFGLKALRAEVDKIDKAIVHQLALREAISCKIGVLKFQQKQKVRDLVREEALKKHHHFLAKKYQLDPVFIQRLFKLILKRSKKIQKPQKNIKRK